MVLTSFLFGATPALARTPNDQRYSDQASMWNQIQAPLAWDKTTGSNRVTVAIIDTGVDSWHEDLAANIWTNPYEIEGNGIDDDNNGYVDDMHGWNFVEKNNDIRTSVFDKEVDKEAVSHGTVSAGLIGAVGNNGRDGTGINWSVKIMSLRAIDSNGGGSYSDVAAAILYAIKNGANVISMSFVGDEYDAYLRSILYQAYQKGIVVVSAMGNHSAIENGNVDEVPLYAACYDKGDTQNWIIGVSAVDASDRLAQFANYGSCVDIVAPGVNIFSLERYAPQFGYNTDFGGGWNGTSFATPLVAGSAALLKALRPEWGPDQIIGAILASADNVDRMNPGMGGKLGVGRLNVGKAVEIASTESGESGVSGETPIVYTIRGNTVERFDTALGKSELVARFEAARVQSVAAYQLPNENAPHLAVLFQRDSFSYVKLFKPTGELWREFALPLSGSEATLARKITILPPSESGEWSFMVSRVNPKRGVTTFTEYDQSGKRLREKSFAGSDWQWDTFKDSTTLVIARVARRQLVIEQYDWHTGKKQVWKEKTPATLLETISAGKLFTDSLESAAVVYRDGQNKNLLLADVPTGSKRRFALGKSTSKELGYLYLGAVLPGKGQELMYFHLSGGTYRLVDSLNQLIAEFRFPAQKGVLIR